MFEDTFFNIHILLEFTFKAGVFPMFSDNVPSEQQVTYQTTTPPNTRWFLVGVSAHTKKCLRISFEQKSSREKDSTYLSHQKACKVFFQKKGIYCHC